MNHLDWRVVGLSTGSFLTVSYVICFVDDLLSSHSMREAWLRLLPGFAWISWPSFFLGLIETFAFVVFCGPAFAPLYNSFHARFAVAEAR